MIERRQVLIGGFLSATAVTTGCVGWSSDSAVAVDNSVNTAMDKMYEDISFTRALAIQAAGMLVMPSVVKGGFLLGGSYGEGALRLPESNFGTTAEYYSFGAASVGYQAGLQRTAHALFFMTEGALAEFRQSDNFEIGVGAEVTVIDAGFKADVNTTASQSPVIAVIFSQQGLLAGASLEGAKYSRITA